MQKKLLIGIGIAVAVLGIAGTTTWGIQQNSKLNEARSQLKAGTDKVTKLENDVKVYQTEIEKLKDTTGATNVDKNAYQSVFLKNNQVYFGKITKLTETQLILENIYYLQVGADGKQTSLTKLGNEVHGPQDVMYIERKEVTFWENLKDDSEVVKAIKQYEAQQTTKQ